MHEQTGTKTWTPIELLPTSTHWSQPKQAQTVTFGPIVGWEKKMRSSNIISREIRFDASWCIYVMYVNRNVHTSIIRIRFGSNRSKNSWHHERPCMQPFWHGAFITGLAFKELATWPTPTGSFLNRSTYSYSSSNGNGSNFYWIHLYPFFMKEEAFQRCYHCNASFSM